MNAQAVNHLLGSCPGPSQATQMQSGRNRAAIMRMRPARALPADSVMTTVDDGGLGGDEGGVIAGGRQTGADHVRAFYNGSMVGLSQVGRRCYSPWSSAAGVIYQSRNLCLQVIPSADMDCLPDNY